MGNTIKVITTVGTSLFTNFLKEEVVELFNDVIKEAKGIRPNDYNIREAHIKLSKSDNKPDDNTITGYKDDIKRKIPHWLSDIQYNKSTEKYEFKPNLGLNTHCCAEVQTLLAIAKKDEYKGKTLEVHLLCTDTQLSQLAAAIIKDLKIPDITFMESAKIDFLQVKDAKNFEEKGFFNLVDKVKSIKGTDTNVILNISGGYKALIPPLTLLAQLEKMTLCYVYEESGELIETGNLPINFDWGVIENYTTYLQKSQSKRDKASDSIIKEMRDLKLVKSDSRDLTIIGSLISKYSQQASPFTQTIFGYLVEYKLDECYALKYGREKVQHGVKFGEMKGTEDIDIFIKPNANEFITMEVKHAGFVLDNETQMDKITKNLIFRAIQAKNSKQGTIKEIWLMLYSYTDIRNNTFILTQAQTETLYKVSQAIKAANICCNALFIAKHFYIESNKSNEENRLDGEVHIYQNFMKSTLKIESIKDITIVKI